MKIGQIIFNVSIKKMLQVVLWWNKDCENDFKCVFNVFLRFDCCESVSVV